MTTTLTLYICAVGGWIVTIVVFYALGWIEGRRRGRIDGCKSNADGKLHLIGYWIGRADGGRETDAGQGGTNK